MSDETDQTEQRKIEKPPKQPNKELQLLQEAGRHLDKFLCQGDQRTDLSDSEVVLVSVLDEWASNAYPASKKYCIEHNIPFNNKEHTLQFLANFLSNFKKFRLARDRKGRTEDKSVMLGYMNMLQDALKNDERKMPAYMK